MTLSYGQAYSIAASITCVVSLLISELAAFGIVKDWSVKVEPDSNSRSLPLTTVTTPEDNKQPYETRSNDTTYLPMSHQ
ncbi:hypothetical protein BCR35DRAFT_159031 [Leucosporidium creatinivorum]|uniref:Uncharacterized protein n=1 Tax=Leucosporidium creatinivorum TaxID=106004 RepID=A0A1Y2FZZ5_9BASI|nr:hypothetical protein BCR35DRAFT_159031 [Leucosporidium creatinivorum]